MSTLANNEHPDRGTAGQGDDPAVGDENVALQAEGLQVWGEEREYSLLQLGRQCGHRQHRVNHCCLYCCEPVHKLKHKHNTY